jgi:hypothetical protein
MVFPQQQGILVNLSRVKVFETAAASFTAGTVNQQGPWKNDFKWLPWRRGFKCRLLILSGNSKTLTALAEWGACFLYCMLMQRRSVIEVCGHFRRGSFHHVFGAEPTTMYRSFCGCLYAGSYGSDVFCTYIWW